ncbi:MAG: beta strand repeat-containing protein, partial [Vitreimonas sp.]
MRIKKIQLAGLAVAVFGVAGEAGAEDVTISTATTTPVATSDPGAGGAVEAGDVTVASGGSITVTAGQTAITVDSSNDVTTNSGGALNATNANNVTGILLQGGNTGNITGGGSISLLETYVLADADTDGDLDGAFATGTNRHGIRLAAGPTFTGNLTTTGAISVEGNNSSGITLDALLTGNLSTSGNIAVVGDNSFGVAINGGVGAGVDGDVIMRGGMTVRGENSSGLVVNAPITGNLIVNGTWSVSGFHNTNRPADISDLDPDDLLIGGPAIAVHHSVTGGIHIEGIGVEDDEDDDGDGETEAEGDTNDDLTASITSFGSGPALLIEADPSADLVLGATASGFGLHVQGGVIASGVYDGVDATAIRIQGSGGRIVDIDDPGQNGIALDGTVTASAQNADAHAVVIGVDARVTQILNRRNVTSAVLSDLAQTSYGILLEAGANVPTITNSGTIRAQLFGEIGDAAAITDASGSLTAINNSGSIIAEIFATDSDVTDNIPPPPITGQATAIDVSANVTGVVLKQTADAPFTDEDATDNDSTVRPATLIRGDILFGSGADKIDLLAGSIQGDVSFGAGADIFNIDNGATYFGRITDSDGALTLNIDDGTLAHTGGTLNLSDATVGADGVLRVLLSDVPGESSFLHAGGSVDFVAGAQIVPIVPVGLPVSGTHLFLTADGGITGAGNVTGVVTGVGSPFLYNLTVGTVLGDPNSLEASYIMKTASELGLNANQSVAFDPIIAALRLDDAAAAAMAALDNQAAFDNAYANLMPSYASASTELAATAIQQMQSATTNRMAHTRLQGMEEVSAWVQEIAYGLRRDPLTVNPQEFRGHGFGLAMGIDGPLDNGALFGLSASFLATEAEEPARPEGEISSWFAQGNAYFGTALGPIDLDFVGGLGFGRLRERRFVEIGSTFATQTEADWWAYEGHGAMRASV